MLRWPRFSGLSGADDMQDETRTTGNRDHLQSGHVWGADRVFISEDEDFSLVYVGLCPFHLVDAVHP